MARGWEHWNECWSFVMGPVGLGRFGRHGPDSIATQGSNRDDNHLKFLGVWPKLIY